MAINKVNTTAEEQSFKFPKNQSSILYTADTNNITINGVNVIVDEPKRGDVMCITRYKAENGSPLPADKQKVIWIDGLSIEPTQLSQEYEPVGICFAVKGNKAFVRYREERNFKWAVSDRFKVPDSSKMNDGAEHTLDIYFDNYAVEGQPPLVLTAADTASRKAFVDKLNTWFSTNRPECSAELVELDTDLPAVDTSDIKNGDSYRNRVIINSPFLDIISISIGGIGDCKLVTGNQTKSINWYYRNNGFINTYEGGCCRAKYYDFIELEQSEPFEQAIDINYVESNFSGFPVTLVDFTNHEYCQLLRDTFDNYDEYLDSMMVKYPCSEGGTITEFPSGKENTYKLADCTYLDNITGIQKILYPATNWAASISLNAPKLGKGNWWLPSSAEMIQMMRDITYGTSFWETEPDIVNRVISKLSSISNSGWSMLSADESKWTSSRYGFKNYNQNAYSYVKETGALANSLLNSVIAVSPITIYEF